MIGNTKKTFWVIRWLRWRCNKGPYRLQIARLRRSGKVVEAFVELTGIITMVRMLQSVPDPQARMKIMLEITRKFTSPNWWKTQ